MVRGRGNTGSGGGGGDYGGGADSDSGRADSSFVAGPGEGITSMLNIVTSLVREYQLQDASRVLSELSALLGGRTIIGERQEGVIIRGMSTTASKMYTKLRID